MGTFLTEKADFDMLNIIILITLAL